MTWVHTLDDQIAVLEEDLARIDRELERVPSRVVDWGAYWVRIDRLRRDRLVTAFDLRQLCRKRQEAA